MNSNNDVRRSIESYSKLRAKWIAALVGSHPNAIWLQMSHMLREEVWFKTVVRLRDSGGNPPVNSYVWDTFTTGYGVKQSLAIRRLTDRKKGTASLLRIVMDMRSNSHYFTRQIVVGHDGTPMDVDELHQQMIQPIAHDEGGVGRIDPIKFQQWSDADLAHRAFDRLRAAGMEKPRLSCDKIDDEVLNKLEGALTSDVFKRVRNRCDTYLAHADLSDLASAIAGPTYNDIHQCVGTLVEVRQFLRGDFLNHSSGSAVPFPQGKHLHDLAEPLVPKFSDSIYADAWKQSAAEVESWAAIDRIRRFAVHQE